MLVQRFPLLQKEGELFYAVSHSSPKLKLTAKPLGGLGVLQTMQNFTLLQQTEFQVAKKRLNLCLNPRVILKLWKNQKKQADLK
jgi:hypothetical protein